LINNAGKIREPLKFLPVEGICGHGWTQDVFEQFLQTNARAPAALTYAVLPLMKKNKFGRIVNISSGMLIPFSDLTC
jgi:NAD(P)-dependent dehydrogenase (short-subunit alcohol dehydrogenase family)